MPMIAPLLYGGFTQLTVTSITSSMTALTAGVAKDFFINIFFHPGDNVMAVMIFCGVVIVSCVGLAFLIMKAYEKYCPENSF